MKLAAFHELKQSRFHGGPSVVCRGRVCAVHPQVQPAWLKFRTAVWAALADKYPLVNINSYAPIRRRPGAAAAPAAVYAAPPVAQPRPQVLGNPFGAPAPVPAPAPAPESTNPFVRFPLTAAPTPAPAVAPKNPFAPAPAPIIAPKQPHPEFARTASGNIKLSPADLEVTAFVGVPESAHLEGLRNFYSAVNPEKMGQVNLAWQKFGAGIWKALAEKYPEINMGKVRRLAGVSVCVCCTDVQCRVLLGCCGRIHDGSYPFVDMLIDYNVCMAWLLHQ